MGSTVLNYAAGRGHLEVVQVLIEQKVDVNQSGRKGTTAVMAASRECHVEVVKILVKAKADVNHVNDQFDTALMFAAAGNYDEIVKILIESNADLNRENSEGFTAFKYAVYLGHQDVVHVFEMVEKAVQDKLKSDFLKFGNFVQNLPTYNDVNQSSSLFISVVKDTLSKMTDCSSGRLPLRTGGGWVRQSD
jgi:ankyrin repeat protein